MIVKEKSLNATFIQLFRFALRCFEYELLNENDWSKQMINYYDAFSQIQRM